MLDAIYFHIPFCSQKCGYCDFLSFASDGEMRKKYVNYLIKEISLYPEYKYDTVYFGGGTPSLLEYKDVEKIIKNIEVAPCAEVTMEVNPKTVDLNYLKKIRSLGVNRLSMGVQSFNDRLLKILGRIHNSQEAIDTYLDARKAGFKNISLDLMFSLPGQTIADVRTDLKQLFKLRPEHFSIYSLIWEEGTPFYKKLEKGEFQITDNDKEAEMYELIISEAEKAGYVHYEISNFALPGFEARHNSKYWENREYLGIGLGASGYIKDLRYKNQVQFFQYYDSIDNGIVPIMEKEKVEKKEFKEYEYILGLRLLKKGIKPEKEYLVKCLKLEKNGFLERKENSFILSKKGIMLANDVLTEFL